MALSPTQIIQGFVSRILPAFNTDGYNSSVTARQSSYGELCTQPLVRKSHNLADEGSYWTASSATGIVVTYGTTITATSPALTIYNGNTSKSVGVDYLALTAIVAGAQTTAAGYTGIQIVVDTGNRYSSAGTQLTPVNVNLLSAGAANVTVWFGALVATAASANARTTVTSRNIRPSVSTTVINVVGDMNLLNFGSVEGATGSIVVANANIMPQAFPPLVIPPLSTGLIYIYYPIMTAPSAATYAPELGFWIR